QSRRSLVFPDLEMTYGAQNWSLQSFLFLDEPGSSYRIDHWLIPLDRYMRTYWKQPIHDRRSPPAGLRFGRSDQGVLFLLDLLFPLEHEAAAKIAGCTRDKIQFFRKAYPVASDEEVSEFIGDPRYRGDVLFLSTPCAPLAASRPIPTPAEVPDLQANSRVDLDYQVGAFGANRLEVTVTVDHPSPVWMLYSDVWHPFWKVTVDGEPRHLWVANLAYKAVELEPGTHVVRFDFHSESMAALVPLFGFASLLWLAILGGFVIANVAGSGLGRVAKPPRGE
ncbi:MAG: hypothetical protein L0Z62_00440, partial [Gemmataceae bacterium]|nr:hypothetical protein [Gemmataceae bacterium]